MSKVFTYDDGTIYVERPGTRWGRVNVESMPISFSGNEVERQVMMDVTPPKLDSKSKGSTILLSDRWLTYLDKAHNHTKEASNWLWSPNMNWFNKEIVDGVVVCENMTFPRNIVRIIGEAPTHYEVWTLPANLDPSKFNPLVFNHHNYPWIFPLQMARNSYNDGQLVGSGQHVYQMNIRRAGGRSWIHKDFVSMFPSTPFIVNYEGSVHIIADYQFVASDVYGIRSDGIRIPLMTVTPSQVVTMHTEWRNVGSCVIPRGAQ